MANKRIAIQLDVNANTKNAKAQLESLQTSLNSLATGSTVNIGEKLTKEIQEGTRAAGQLAVALQQATNINTGRLDMTAFSNSLKRAGTDIKTVSNQLAQLGPQGAASLQQLANQIMTADTSILRLSAGVGKLLTTFANTARWMLSSAALNGVLTTVTSAWDYTKRLNESLNNIRIVTGQTTDQMAEFAAQANKAAKALSATTTEYTNAALIYYQQGLSDEEVLKRTETTIKLANVAGESAESVSEWMTAIWNNFDDGSKSLEYYADVITALGAATASSSEEIATGLEKFAAVAESVGLSYEYATSALATITATTRQSADVVGTALKTLFARMQDLELGKTLDDGTSLGQYSDTLARIGVNVLDLNGELRDMDIVLEEVGARWNDLTNAQKVATAQGVAGIRQYTQFLALMENWDFMQQNIMIAQTSTGSLDQQQEIYAQGWEAAADRVKAATEGIWDALLNDEFFISLTNGFSKFLEAIEKVAKSMGGMKGVLAGVSAVIFKLASPQISNGLNKLGMSLYGMTKAGRQAIANETTNSLNAISNSLKDTGNTPEAEAINRQKIIQDSISKRRTPMSAEEQGRYQLELQMLQTYEQQNAENAKAAQIEAEKARLAKTELQQEEATLKNLQEQRKTTAEFRRNNPNNKRLAEEELRLTNRIEAQKKKVAAARAKDTSASEAAKRTRKAADESQKAVEKSAKGIINAYGQSAKAALSWSQVVTQAMSALSSTAFALTSFTSLWETIKDPDMSGWEKFTSILMSVSFLLPSLIGAFKSFKTILSKETLELLVNTAATIGNTKAKQANSASRMGKFAPKEKTFSHVNDNGRTYKAQYFKDGRDPVYTSTDQKGVTRVITERGYKDGAGLTKQGMADEANFISNAGTGLGSMAAMAGAIAALVAVIVATTLVIKHFQKQAEEYAKEAERASKLARESQEAASQVRQEYESLKQTIEGLDEKQTKLDTMVEGTREWKEAVSEVNAEIQQLLAKYPELATYVKSVNGQLILDKQGQEFLLDQQLEKADKAQNVANLNQLHANDANMRNVADSFAREGDWNAGATIGTSAGAGAVIGGVIGSFIAPVLGTILGAAIGGLAGLVPSWIGIGVQEANSDREREATLDLIATWDPATESLEKAIQDLNIADEGLIKSLKSNEDEIKKLVNENSALIKATNLLRQSILKEYARDIDPNDQWSEEEEDYISRKYKLSTEKENEIRRNAETWKVNNAEWNKQQAEEWLKYAYGDQAENYRITDYDGDSFTIQKKDENGGWDNIDDEKNTRDYNDILADLAVEEAYKKIIEQYGQSDVEEFRGNVQDFEKLNRITGLNFDKNVINDWAASAGLGETLKVDNLTYEDMDLLYKNRDALDENNDAYKAITTAYHEYDDAVIDSAAKSRKNYEGLTEVRRELTKIQEELDMTTTSLENYADAVATALGVTDDETFTTSFVRITAKATAAITGLNKVVNEYSETLSDPNLLSPDFAKALGEIETQLKNWLGDENLDISEQFLRDNLTTIQEFAQGNLTNLNSFMDKLTVDTMKEYSWNTNTQSSMTKIISGLASTDYKIGSYMQQSEMDALSALLAGDSTVKGEELIQLLAMQGFSAEEAMTEDGRLDFSKLRYVGLGEYADLSALEDLGEELMKQIDRYHEIKEILDDISNALDEASKRKEKAFGAGSLAFLKQETDLLQRQGEALKQYQKEAEGYLVQDKAALEAAGFGFEFDTQGRISNYREIMEGLAARTDSAGMAQAEELIKQYEESLNLAEDLNGQILDNHYALLDAKLEAVTTKVELKLDINERDKEYLDFLAGLMEDDRHITIDLIGNYTSQRGLIESNIAANEVGLKGTYNLIMSGQGTKETVEAMQDYYSNLLEEANNYRELGKQVIEAVKAEFESWNEDLDKAADGITHLTKVLEGLQNIIDVIGQENLGISDEVIGEMVKAQAEAANGALTASKETLEANRVALSEAEASLKIAQEELAKNPESRGAKDVVNYWQEAVDVAKKAVEEGELDVYEKWATALQAAADEFKWNTQQIADAFSEALGGIYGTIQDMSEAFGRQKELSELYLADYKKIYEVNKLNRKFNESIDTTSSVKAQRLLREAQEDLLAYQKAGVEMSKYDLEYKQKEYDLLVAQIALEEAQNAKSQVRLTKDSSGNWGYIYTADAAETEKAEQEYEDKLYAMQDFMAESEVELSEYYIQALNEYYDTVQKLAEKYGEGSEKYLKGVEEAQKVLSTKTSYSLGELEGLTTRAEQLNSEFAANCVATFKDTILGGMYSEYNNFKELQNGVTLALEESVNELTGAYGDLQTKISNVCSLAGVNIEEFSKFATGKTNEVVNKTKDLVTEVGKIAGAYKTAFQGVLDEAKAFYGQEGQQGYKYWIDKYIEKITEWTKAMDAAMAKQAKLDKQQADNLARDDASKRFASTNFGTLLGNKATGSSDSVYNTVAKKIFENEDAKGVLWNYGKDGKTQQLTSKGASIAQGAASSWTTAATSAAASSIYTAMGNSTSIGSPGSKSYNTAMGAGSSAINNLGIEDYLNNTYNIDSKISGAVSSGSNKVSGVDNTIQKYTYERVTRNDDKNHNYYDEATNNYHEYGISLKDSNGTEFFFDVSGLEQNKDWGYDGNSLWINSNAYDSNRRTNADKAERKIPISETVLGAAEGWNSVRKLFRFNAVGMTDNWYGIWNIKGHEDEEEDIKIEDYTKGTKIALEDLVGDGYEDNKIQKYGEPYKSYLKGGTITAKIGDPQAFSYKKDNDYPTSKRLTDMHEKWQRIDKGKKYKVKQVLGYPTGNDISAIRIEDPLPGGKDVQVWTRADAWAVFDTGGYTGEWGSSGKMAMLHEKEIVLNKYDTANLLSAIDLVRQFESSFASMKWGLGALTAVNQLHHNYSDTLEQNVTIHAEFPNATDHREIEEAFDNLVNLASQYAQRK